MLDLAKFVYRDDDPLTLVYNLDTCSQLKDLETELFKEEYNIAPTFNHVEVHIKQDASEYHYSVEKEFDKYYIVTC